LPDSARHDGASVIDFRIKPHALELNDPLIRMPELWPLLFLAVGTIPVLLILMIWLRAIDALVVFAVTFVLITLLAWLRRMIGRMSYSTDDARSKLALPEFYLTNQPLCAGTDRELRLLHIAIAKASGQFEADIVIRLTLVRLLFVFYLAMPLFQALLSLAIVPINFGERTTYWSVLFMMCFWAPWWTTVIWGRRYSITPGVLRIFDIKYPLWSVTCRREILLTKAKIACRFDEHVLEIRDAHGELRVSLLEVFRPIEFCANILRAASPPHDARALSSART
jgi:hypothetical protein